MNTLTRKTLSRLMIAAALCAATAPARADDVDITALMAAQVGRIIASQGNAALETIQQEVKAKLSQSLELFLPEAPAPAAATKVNTVSGPETVVIDEFAARGSI